MRRLLFCVLTASMLSSPLSGNGISAIQDTENVSMEEKSKEEVIKNFKQEVKTTGGGFDMCRAIKEMLRDSRQEGRQEGIEKRQNNMQQLNKILIAAGRLEDLLHASIDNGYCMKLMTELGII